MTSDNILILGGTGKTGRRVAERLKSRNLPVRIGSRSGEPPFDWNKPDTWTKALQGINAVYITYQPDLAVPGAVDAIGDFSARAVASGVRRLVLLSGRGEQEAQACEQIIQQAGAEWTILRASWFNQNFSENFLAESLLAGEVMLPVGAIPEPFVDAEDIAEVAVAALTDSKHVGQLYELTGPRLLTFAQAIAEIATVTGREIHFVQVAPAEYNAALQEAGISEDYLWLVNYLFTTVMDGRNAYLADGVQRALGRNPRDFANYVRDTATTGVWQVPSGEQV